MASPPIPDDFRCPISLELMSDPVILPSGHTFDRSSIQKWLDSSSLLTCPITQLPLHNPTPPSSLIPNIALRSLISQYAHTHNLNLQTPQSSHLSASSPSLRQNIKQLVCALLSRKVQLSCKGESLSRLLRLSKERSSREVMVECGAVSALLGCVKELELQEGALNGLVNLSLDGDDEKVGLVAEGAVGAVVGVLRIGKKEARAVSATLITSLAVVEVNKGTIGGHPGAIQGLVELLAEGNYRGKKEAATALYTLCTFPENRRRTVEAGAVPILVELAMAGMERPVEVLSLLAKCSEGRETMVSCKDSVAVLVRVLKDGKRRSQEHALAALNLLCSNCERSALEARSSGVLELCLEFLGDENAKVRRNATALIQAVEI